MDESMFWHFSATVQTLTKPQGKNKKSSNPVGANKIEH